LLQPKNLMVSPHAREKDKDRSRYISILNIIQGDVDPSQLHQSLMRIRERKLASFIEWGPASIQVALSRSSPYVKSSHRVSGLMLANHTSIRHLFNRTLSQFDKMYKKGGNSGGAFTQTYKDYPMFTRMNAEGREEFNPEEFEDAREVVGAVSEEYAACEKVDYIEPIDGMGSLSAGLGQMSV
jgi:tubulin gamma